MKMTVVVFGMIAVSGVLHACGGSGSNEPKNNSVGSSTTVAAPAISTTITPVSTPAEAAKTVNASKTLASSFASGTTFPSLGSLVGKPAADQVANSQRIISTVRYLQQKVSGLVEKQNVLGKQVAAAQVQACTDGGSMSVDQASSPMAMSFFGCKMGNEYMNGTMSYPSGLGSSISSGTLVVNLTSISYSSSGTPYTTKLAESALNMTMTISTYDAATKSANFSINGTGNNIDYSTGTSDKQAFGNFSVNMTESLSGSITTTSMTLNGSVSMDVFKDTTFATIDTASGMTFKALILTETFNATTNNTALTMNGTFAIKTVPACNDGTFAITTQAPITTTSAGVTTGQITVNGVVMLFNADGTVTATIGGVVQPKLVYANVCSLSF